MRRYSPDELLKKFYEIRNSISDEEFFRSPDHKKTQELWCAAHFGRGVSSHIAACDVLIHDHDAQTDADFVLVVAGVALPFQVTEVQAPGRRRGDEHLKGLPGPFDDSDYSTGNANGPQWVRGAIEKKLARRYSNSDKLNVLIYVNFAAWDQQYLEIIEATREIAQHFASVWLISGNALCCIKEGPGLELFEGWRQIEESTSET